VLVRGERTRPLRLGRTHSPQARCPRWPVAEGANASLCAASGMVSPWASSPAARAWASGRAPSRDGSHRHAPPHLRTFRSCSSSSTFGAPWAFAFSWGSSDSASLSEFPSAASVLAAAGEETTGEPFCPHRHGAANSRVQTPCRGGQGRARASFLQEPATGA